tara:strand:+ start:202 stop:987 length:786 start_codon:yes stop_codon:yes gene_type:complete
MTKKTYKNLSIVLNCKAMSESNKFTNFILEIPCDISLLSKFRILDYIGYSFRYRVDIDKYEDFRICEIYTHSIQPAKVYISVKDAIGYKNDNYFTVSFKFPGLKKPKLLKIPINEGDGIIFNSRIPDKIYNYKHAQYDGWDIPKFSIGRDKHAFYAKNNPELDFFDHNMVYEADEDTTGILYRFPISCWETSTQPKPNICYENENEYRDRNELFTMSQEEFDMSTWHDQYDDFRDFDNPPEKLLNLSSDEEDLSDKVEEIK